MPELPKAYEPQQVEDRLYAKWQESGVFRADPKSRKPPYSIVMPPPNVTGKLTLGHVLNNTIQDILARKARMEGKEVLWLPGTDHAGLATQTAVEKHLRASEKKTRHDFTREEFVARVWKWKEEFGGIITDQLRKIGASCDWSRERFTLDDDYAQAVQEVFVKLYEEGHIYRGTRMVNWCPGSLTALSDEEVIPTKQKGSLYYVKYELVEEPPQKQSVIPSLSRDQTRAASDGTSTATAKSKGDSPSPSLPNPVNPVQNSPAFLIVATTRPETIMADVALAVKPGGKWAHLIGKKVWRPLHRAEIPIIADEAVEEAFGTGILKVTPAHDKTDYEIGKRHNLPVIDILTPNAKIHDPGEHDAIELNGLDRFEARKRSAEMLKERGLLEKEEPHESNVGFSERANVPIEPRLSEQWFMRYPDIPDALALLRDGHVKFHPAHWTKVYEHWLENIQDWCISRQVWWGHRIPVWYSKKPIQTSTSSPSDLAKIDQSVIQKQNDVLWEDASILCQIEKPEGEGWVQDPDTLDTWFSSWLWAYETMRTEDGTRQKFYPTSALVTGPDIIFLWVARMLIAGLHFKPSGEFLLDSETLEMNLAFKDVYFTGLIRDQKGRKLSKSLGNSPDPLELIAKYGADGLRFGLVRIAPQGADIRFDEKQIEEGRNFCNKLWNICRFRALYGPIDPAADPTGIITNFSHALLVDLDLVLNGPRMSSLGGQSIGAKFANFEFSEAANIIYDFVWNSFASRFVEAAKIDFQNPQFGTSAGTLATFDYTMSRVLRLLHPLVPFITEELWCELGFGNDTISLSQWPTHTDLHYEQRERNAFRANAIYRTADEGRKLRSTLKISSNQRIPFTLEFNAPYWMGGLPSPFECEVLKGLLNASHLELFGDGYSIPARIDDSLALGPKTFTPLGQLYLPATGLVDPALERDRLEKELAKVLKDLEQTRRKLGDAKMLAKAPAAKIEEWRALEKSLAEKEKSLRETLQKLG